MPNVTVFEATTSSPVEIDSVKYIIRTLHHLRIIDVKPSGDEGDWADLINAAAIIGKFGFGHQVIDYVPRNLLLYQRHLYSSYPKMY